MSLAGLEASLDGEIPTARVRISATRPD